jgi:hypothetical protein
LHLSWHHLVAFGAAGCRYAVHTLVESAALLHRHARADIPFMLAGQGDQMPVLRRRAAGLPNATIEGWLKQRALTAPIEAATAGLCARAPGALLTPHKPFVDAGLPGVSSRRRASGDVPTEGLGGRRASRVAAGILLRGRGC